MRWLTVAGVLLYLTRCNDAGALKCHPGSQDPLCVLEKKEISEPSTSTCKPNTTFKKDDSTCVCLENGLSLCTQRPHRIDKRSSEQEECTPGTTLQKECNSCTCLPNGKLVCTKRGCVNWQSRKKREISAANATSRSVRAAAEPPKACQPGQEFRMDCNKCLCNDEGQDFSCTRMDCAALNGNGGGGDTFVTRRRRDTTARIEHDCAPGAMFNQDCHACLCDTDGKHASCTINECKKDKDVTTEPSPSFRCTPGDQFRRDCNDCTCSADGNNIYCTLRLCDEVLGDITP